MFPGRGYISLVHQSVSPCNRPMRKRDRVMERMGWEQKWARMGVKVVIDPQAAADSRSTFSPPTLRTQPALASSQMLFEHKKGSEMISY